jgi:hypothetical protein
VRKRWLALQSGVFGVVCIHISFRLEKHKPVELKIEESTHFLMGILFVEP